GSEAVYLPGKVTDETDWKAISAGREHSLALKTDGTLWAWGANNWGQLGDGTGADRSTPAPVNEETDWTAVSAGRDHSLALKTDGTLWAWGANN
ncbi:hypothetical protein LLG90_27875, partial [Aromatoleum toluclasticum]|uniref:RCC1 domain-containing protein n=1 Tax=Aromatoleum toluclasticum TaxID=92003 RepID=UPI0034DB56CF|nr:hypothetical protein [Aromatoleum toluclasticum]